ncbi:anti-sigma factor domain-containing protein [Halobacillus naozhouensis]|uniref:Anti-sigma factor domain-containing protein n=1 Tax=Halobacillus naozhouensis TaxID=554880 RepID=A0ABY8J0H6_9BACI|nr:anti-sigma factor domain-containing protein [Halobacillus naozhouensis]WFT75989.1 anti-sigma factor domain-containing protein [Halobacillus naozhouensis]
MRKGIVMEQSRAYTIVMTNDGTFHKAKLLKRAEVGMEVYFRPTVAKHRGFTQLFMLRKVKFAAVTLALLIAFFPAYLWYGSNKAYAYVNIDMNPSVELKLNKRMEVIDVIPLNEDAEVLLSKLENWQHDPASEVTFDMITLSQKLGYINNQNQVLIGVSYVNKHDEDFSAKIESYLAKQSFNLSIASYNVPSQMRKQAKKEKVSVNELMADSLSEAKNEASAKVTVEADDKAIIQSYYNKSESSESTGTEMSKPSQQINRDSSKEMFIIPREKFKHLPSQAKENHNPPGQAKKKNHSSPQGQANRSEQADEHANDHPASNKEKANKNHSSRAKNKEHSKTDPSKGPDHKPDKKPKHDHKNGKNKDHNGNGTGNKHNNGKVNKEKGKGKGPH